MRISSLKSSFLLVPFFSLVAMAAAAGEPSRLAEFRDWAAYAYDEPGKKICFAGSRAISRKSDDPGRPAAWALVTRDPAAGTSHVVSIVPGYEFKPGSAVEIEIGRRRFFLFSKQDTAWALDDETDERIVAAMKRGRTMYVTATTRPGRRSKHRFSLMGFSDALAASARACEPSAGGGDPAGATAGHAR